MTQTILFLENIDNDKISSKTPVWVNINNDNYLPGFLVDIEGVDPVMGHIVLKEGKECFRHIWIPLKTKDNDFTRFISKNELQQILKT
jgi:hypothetical protein